MRKYFPILKKVLLISILTCTILIIAFLLYLYLNFHSNTGQENYSQLKNGVWMKHDWVGKVHSDEEYSGLCQLFIDNRITDAFFHVGPLNEKGQIEKDKYLYAQTLIEKMKSCNTDVNIQAWIGQIEVKGGGILNVENEEVRSNVIATSSEFLQIGFDGIHYNIEPIYKGDKEIIDILKRTKDITSKDGKILSIAADELEPFRGSEFLARILFERAGFWDRDYYMEITQYVDQIAVMTYDTALPTDWLYGSIVQWQTSNLLSIVDSDKTIFIGIPTYDDKSFGHNPSAENMESGVRSIKKGVEGIDQKKLKNFGVSIYAEWTTDQDEWEYYQNEWIGE